MIKKVEKLTTLFIKEMERAIFIVLNETYSYNSRISNFPNNYQVVSSCTLANLTYQLVQESNYILYALEKKIFSRIKI